MLAYTDTSKAQQSPTVNGHGKSLNVFINQQALNYRLRVDVAEARSSKSFVAQDILEPCCGKSLCIHVFLFKVSLGFREMLFLKKTLRWAWLFKLCGQRLFRKKLPYDTLGLKYFCSGIFLPLWAWRANTARQHWHILSNRFHSTP